MKDFTFARKGIAILLATALMMLSMPIYAQAADDEYVLTGLSYTPTGSTNTIDASLNGYDITLVVPYGTSDPVDLSSGIDIEFNSSLYQGVHQPEFQDNPLAVIDGDPVLMKVYYQGIRSSIIDVTTYNITVKKASYNGPKFSGTISKEISLPEDTVNFAAADFSRLYTANDGENLGAIVIKGSNPSFGSLRLNGAAYNFRDFIRVAEISAGDLVFRATDSGTVSFSVYAYEEGEEDTGLGPATLVIRVDPETAPDILYTLEEGNLVKFSAGDFTRVCTATTGQALSNVKFTLPPTSSGRLFYNYAESSGTGTAVSSSTRYYAASSPYLGNITFVPSSSLNGTAVIAYTGYTKDFAYTGKIKITVRASLVDVINYTTGEDEEITLDSDDFNAVCQDVTGSNLSYVKFTLPSSSYGRLFYNYVSSSSYDSRVTSTAKYYRSGSPDLDKVTFVPYTNYNGTVTITYNGYSTSGKYYTGKIKITVKAAADAAETIKYTTDAEEELTFDSDDFNEVCNDVTGENLSYVKFTLPSAAYGRLYYDYVSSSRYDSRVSATTKYYRSQIPDLDKVTFVPYSNFNGTVTITYTGYSTRAESYTGKIQIVVGKVTTFTTINYRTLENTRITFDSDDFNEVCQDLTGDNLSYVKFTLPSTSYGRLYYRYVSASNYDSRVTAATKYYRSTSPDLDYVSFVPASGFNGTVTISYTGYSTRGESFNGKIKISVAPAIIANVSKYFADVNTRYSWAATYIDYLYEQGVVAGIGRGRYSPAAQVTRGDFMLMLYNALDLAASNVQGNFPDVPRGSYYYQAIAVARALGIAQGSGGYFWPNNAVTREESMALVARALAMKGESLPAGNYSVLSSFYDRSLISNYALSSVISLVSADVINGYNHYLHPRATTTRAEMAVILYRVMHL